MKPLDRCPACATPLAEADALHPAGLDVRYARCSNCGLLSLSPRPEPEEIARFYSTASYGLGPGKFPSWLEQFRSRAQRQRAAWVEARSQGAAGPVLDIGCGSGEFLRCMAARGHAIHGTELAGPAADRARAVPGLELRLGSLDGTAYPAQSFAIITMWHVLEHLPDPAMTLRDCRRWLQPGGRLYLEVPNLSSWQARLFGKYWLHLDPPRHLHQFTARALDTLLRQAGFELEERATFSLSMGWMGTLQSGLNVLMRPRDLFYNLLLTRGQVPAGLPRKIIAVVAALLWSPVALLLALAEALARRGAVLRYCCRASQS